MDKYLAVNRVLYKDFGRHVQALSERLKKASLARAEREQPPIQYLSSSAVSKEEVARRIAQQDGVQQD